MLLAVPVPGGAVLPSAAESDPSWHVEQLPLHHEVDALTLLPGSVNGRDNIDITYREGNHLLYIWRWVNGLWYSPFPVQWEN